MTRLLLKRWAEALLPVAIIAILAAILSPIAAIQHGPSCAKTNASGDCLEWREGLNLFFE